MKKLESFSPVTKKPKKTKYPWEQFLSGDIWSVDTMKEFSVKRSGFRTRLHTKAKEMGYGLKTSFIGDNVVEFQFTKKEDTDE